MRLLGWDYSSESTYFITIRTKQKGNILGEIIDGEMHANKIGQIAEEFIKEISIHFNNTKTHASVIMPDHVHILLEINKHGNNKPHYSVAKLDIKRSSKGSLPIIINQYKGAVKRYCNKNNLEFKWQNKFFDRIIRDENELENTIIYIQNNPKDYWRKHNLF